MLVEQIGIMAMLFVVFLAGVIMGGVIFLAWLRRKEKNGSMASDNN